MSDTAQALSTPRGDRLPVFNILGTTFSVFGRAPLPFLVFSAIAAAPGLVRLATLGPASQKFTLSAWIVLVVSILLNYLIQTAMTYLAARIYEGGDATMGEALRVGSRRYLPMVGAMILFMLCVILGSAALFVPGLIFLCMFAVTQPACALEPLGPIDSMKRSKALTQGSRWRILGIYILFFGPLIVLSVLSAFLLIRPGHLMAGLVVNALISLVWAPLSVIFTTIVYIELRRLKEHLGVATVFD